MLIVKRASEADVDALVPLKAAVHALHVAERPDVFKAMRDDQVGAWLRHRLGEDDTIVWIAEEEGAPVGYALTARRERGETSFSSARAWCEIDEVVVEERCRGRGVARALIERIVAHTREVGLDGVELTTWAFNDGAHAAFARMGFSPMIVRYERRVAPGTSDM